MIVSYLSDRHLKGKHDQSTHGHGGGLSDEQYTALAPASSWSADKREEILGTLGKTEEGKILADTLDKFQDGGSIGHLRSSVAKFAKGEEQNPTSHARAAALTGAIRHVPAGYAPATLHRGMSIPGSQKTVLGKFKPGDTMDLNVTSFSSDKAMAFKFQQMTQKSGKTARVRVELVGGSTKALPIQNLARDRRLFPEKEWVTGGRFKILETKKDTSGGVIIRIEQTAALGE